MSASMTSGLSNVALICVDACPLCKRLIPNVVDRFGSHKARDDLGRRHARDLGRRQLLKLQIDPLITNSTLSAAHMVITRPIAVPSRGSETIWLRTHPLCTLPFLYLISTAASSSLIVCINYSCLVQFSPKRESTTNQATLASATPPTATPLKGCTSPGLGACLHLQTRSQLVLSVKLPVHPALRAHMSSHTNTSSGHCHKRGSAIHPESSRSRHMHRGAPQTAYWCSAWDAISVIQVTTNHSTSSIAQA